MERPSKEKRIAYLSELATLFEKMVKAGYTADEIALAVEVGTGAKLERHKDEVNLAGK